MNKKLRILFLSLGIVSIFVILMVLKLPSDTNLWRAIHNAGHTPLFGALSLFLLGLFMNLLAERPKRRLFSYLLAFSVAFLLGLLLEVYQIWGRGDAELVDVLRDLAGITAFLLIAAAFDKNINALHLGWVRNNRIQILTAAILILGIAFATTIKWAISYHYRDSYFPTVMDFESSWETRFVKAQNAELKVVPPPPEWENHSPHVGRITLMPGNYPGIAIEEPYSDWSGYEKFRFDIFSELKESIGLTLRINDRYHRGDYSDRFNERIIVAPGVNDIEIPIERIIEAPAKRRMDIKAIKSIMLFSGELKDSFVLYVDNFRLE